MRLFHRTDAGTEILRDGFRDSDVNPTRDGAWKGVWFSDRPLDGREGLDGGDLLVLEVDDELAERYEWRDDDKPYREFVIPQEVVKEFGRPQRASGDRWVPARPPAS